MQPKMLGALNDPRTDEQKEFDITHQELYTSSVPSYLPSLAEASKYVGMFPVDNQYQTSSCVAHGKVMVMSIFNYVQGFTNGIFVQLSSMFIYRNRINYPQEGMIPSSANQQTVDAGAPVYADLPTPQTEAEANALVIDAATTKSAKAFAAGKWVTLLDPTDIDTMAFVSNSLNLPLDILIYATTQEWSAPVVEILTPGLLKTDAAAEVDHCVTVLPASAYEINGKKYVVVQDSAGFGGIFFRSVSGEFIEARCSESDYMIAMGSMPTVTRPRYTFNTDLTVGMESPDVLGLQQCLQYMGYMPNVVNGQPFNPTSYYGGLTKTAVLQFQNEYASEILTPEGLTVGTGYCGASTRAFLNGLFK